MAFFSRIISKKSTRKIDSPFNKQVFGHITNTYFRHMCAHKKKQAKQKQIKQETTTMDVWIK